MEIKEERTLQEGGGGEVVRSFDQVFPAYRIQVVNEDPFVIKKWMNFEGRGREN